MRSSLGLPVGKQSGSVALWALVIALNLSVVPLSRAASEMVINGRPLSPAEIAAMERLVGGRLVPGRYWYDRSAGLWGYEGGPPAGFAIAGLSVGGHCRPTRRVAPHACLSTGENCTNSRSPI